VNSLKTYSVLSLLLIFTFSSVGIAISKHVCYAEGITEISLIGISTCGDHESEDAAKSCCKKPLTQSKKKQGCCDEDFLYAVLDVIKNHEEKTKEEFDFSPIFVFSFLNYFDNFLNTEFSNSIIKEYPPLLYSSVNNYLSTISVFRL
jgi:hypothetical protein